MHDRKPDIRNPDQEQFWKRRMLARRLASWRNRRSLIVIIGLLLAAYCVAFLPWGEWDIPSLFRNPSRILRFGRNRDEKTYAPFTTTGFDGQRALEDVKKFVALGPRVSGTDGARKAADYLAAQLKNTGVSPIIEEFTETTPNGAMTFRNVIGMLGGKSGPLIILVSHYDTKGGVSDDFVGANDSGSSSGLLLALARSLHSQPGLHPGILFAFLDGEECVKRYSEHDGLSGSRYMAHKLSSSGAASNVVGVIVLDMVGDRDLTITLPGNSTPELVTLVLDAAKEEGARLKFSLLGIALLDDHEPFLRARMPAVDIVDFQYGSAPDKNDYWHTPQDTLDKLSAESLETVGRVTIRTINKLIETTNRKSGPVSHP